MIYKYVNLNGSNYFTFLYFHPPNAFWFADLPLILTRTPSRLVMYTCFIQNDLNHQATIVKEQLESDQYTFLSFSSDRFLVCWSTLYFRLKRFVDIHVCKSEWPQQLCSWSICNKLTRISFPLLPSTSWQFNLLYMLVPSSLLIYTYVNQNGPNHLAAYVYIAI